MKDFCNISEIYKNNIELFKDLESLLTSKKFPCLFAMNSFHKNHMYNVVPLIRPLNSVL